MVANERRNVEDMFLGRLTTEQVLILGELFHLPELFDDSEALITVQNKHGQVAKIDSELICELSFELNRSDWGHWSNTYETVSSKPARSEFSVPDCQDTGLFKVIYHDDLVNKNARPVESGEDFKATDYGKDFAAVPVDHENIKYEFSSYFS